MLDPVTPASSVFDNVRMAPACERIYNEHATTFAFHNLMRTLFEFGCGMFESDEYVKWFWATAPTWKPRKSQAEFSAFARERLSDKVGYTRRRNKAWGVIDALFQKEQDVTFADVLKAIIFLCPTKPLPFETIENGMVTLVDLGNRILKLDRDFMPLMVLLYPWENHDDRIIKRIPVGSLVREFDLAQLAFWQVYPDAEKGERTEAIDFYNGDKLDWRGINIYSTWREGPLAKRMADRFWKTPGERGSGILSFDPTVLARMS